MDTDKSRELDQITIHSQADLQRLWELLMRPLGFRSRSIWLTFIDPDRRPLRSLMEVAECDEEPGPDDVANLYAVLRDVLEDHDHENGADPGSGHSVAILVTRPSREHETGHGLEPDDRALGRLFVEGARLAGVPLEPVHIATDRNIVVLAPDDLAA